MNNCPKCGNPLQAGISTCPICGTNINPVNTVGVPQTPTQPNPVQPINVAPMQPQATPVMGVNQPMPNGAINMQPQTPINNVQTQPVMQPNPVQPVQGVATPSPAPVEQKTPVVTSEQVVSTPTTPEVAPKSPEVETNNQTEKPIELPKVKKESKLNKKMLVIIIGVIAIIAIIAIVLILVLGKQKETKPTTGTNDNTNNAVALKMSKVTSGGYIYNLPESWTTQMSNNLEDIILVNEEGTVAISLDNFTGSLENIDPEAIKTYLDASTYTDVTVTETTIGSRKCILVTGKYNNYPTQIYYIENGATQIVGAAVVYETEEAKILFEADVKTVMESVNYAEVSNAIDPSGLYGSIFRMFENTLLNSEKMPESSYIDDQYSNTQDTITNDTTDTTINGNITNDITDNTIEPTN